MYLRNKSDGFESCAAFGLLDLSSKWLQQYRVLRFITLDQIDKRLVSVL